MSDEETIQFFKDMYWLEQTGQGKEFNKESLNIMKIISLEDKLQKQLPNKEVEVKKKVVKL